MQLVDYDGERQHLLKAFAVRVLDAVGIRFGPAHCELMWSNGEPVLIEVGARLSAGINAVLSQACGGIGQMNETVNAVMRPEQFLATVDVQPRLNRYAVNVFLRPHRNGRLAETRHIDRLEGLPTLDSLSLARKPGTTLNGVSGRITLVSPEAEAIQRDLAVIQELEGLGIFQLLEEPIDLTDDGG